MTELCKAQCQQSFTGNHQTDELIQKIDQAGKLSELPEKAFDNLMNYRGKQLNFNEKTIESLKKIEKKATLTEQEKSSLAYEIASNPHHISQLPQESKKNVDETFSNKNEEMKKFFELIEPEKLSSHVKSELPIYEQLLSRIENGQKPSDHELQKLDILHDELVRYNMLDAMPNRSQAFLENYQTEQELKQKAPHNAYQLLEKLKAEQPLKVFEAFYLSRYMPKEKQETHPIYGVTNFYKEINKTLENLPQDVRDKASEAQELVDDKAIKAINKMVDDILVEHKINQPIDFRFNDVAIKVTSEIVEIRFKGANNLITQLNKHNTDEKYITNIASDPNHSFWADGFRSPPHAGIDYTAHNHDGVMKYGYGFKQQPQIMRIFAITKDTSEEKYINRGSQNITLLEYHEAEGLLLTTLRHLSIAYVKTGQGLMRDERIGSYVIPAQFYNDKQIKQKVDNPKKIINEHIHVEYKFVSKDKLNQDSAEKLQQQLAQLKPNHQMPDDMKNEVNKFVEFAHPAGKGEYHAMAFFMPNSPLNQEFIKRVDADWRPYHQALLTSERLLSKNGDKTDVVKTIENIKNYLEAGKLRDVLKLEALAELLQELKIMLQSVNEYNSELDTLIHYAKQTAINLKETKDLAKYRVIVE